MKHFKLFPAVQVLIMAIVLIGASHLPAAVTFWNDFDGNDLDPTQWGYENRDWPIGNNWLRIAPTISGGTVIFEHHIYNPFDPDNDYYDSVHHWWKQTITPTLGLTKFNTFKILWSADSLQWNWDPDQVRRQDLFPDIFIYETSYAMPDKPLTSRMNFWASTSDWPLARYDTIQPITNPADDVVYNNEVDYFKAIRFPAPTSLILVAIGLLSLRYTRQLKP